MTPPNATRARGAGTPALDGPAELSASTRWTIVGLLSASITINLLDRREDLRTKSDAVAALRHRSDTRITVVAGETPILKRHDGEALSVWFSHGETELLGPGLEEAFLGLAPDGSPRFARLID